MLFNEKSAVEVNILKYLTTCQRFRGSVGLFKRVEGLGPAMATHEIRPQGVEHIEAFLGRCRSYGAIVFDSTNSSFLVASLLNDDYSDDLSNSTTCGFLYKCNGTTLLTPAGRAIKSWKPDMRSP